MEQSKDQIHKKIYIEKERMIRIMKQEVPEIKSRGIIETNNVVKVAKVPIQAQFNRVGNFVDKFLAVTYTATDTDVMSVGVEGETRGKRMENI